MPYRGSCRLKVRSAVSQHFASKSTPGVGCADQEQISQKRNQRLADVIVPDRGKNRKEAGNYVQVYFKDKEVPVRLAARFSAYS